MQRLCRSYRYAVSYAVFLLDFNGINHIINCIGLISRAHGREPCPIIPIHSICRSKVGSTLVSRSIRECRSRTLLRACDVSRRAVPLVSIFCMHIYQYPNTT